MGEGSWVSDTLESFLLPSKDRVMMLIGETYNIHSFEQIRLEI